MVVGRSLEEQVKTWIDRVGCYAFRIETIMQSRAINEVYLISVPLLNYIYWVSQSKQFKGIPSTIHGGDEEVTPTL
ncbi:hypothetical protein Tco_0070664 [Tanacetum coccineum]